MHATAFARPRTDGAPVVTASTSARDPVIAVAELKQALQSPTLGAVLFFCSAEYDLNRLAEVMADGFQGITLSGCTSAGEITPRGYERGSIAAIGFDRRWFSVQAALIEGLEDFDLPRAQHLVDDLLHRCRQADLAPVRDNTFAVTLLDGLSSREELVLSSLNAALGAIPQFGGSAGDDERLANTHVFHDGRFHTSAATVLLVNTPLSFQVFTTHHLAPTDRKLVVTAANCQTRTVHELNAEPAAVAYARAVGVSPDQLCREVFALKPMAVRIGDHYFARSVQRVNEDQSLTFYCAVETGIVLTPMTPGSLRDDLRQRLEEAEATVGKPMVTIGCDCFLRRLEAEQAGEVARISDFLKQHRVLGFSTYGEQFDGVHLNQTFTGVVIGQP
ncbi:nitric oxide-sensing protein NosP [Marinobacter sp. AN1]|uniref:nitric oxide-sensing protein NosP n=1 Tax=Marinobacter sp. AN1 TaxID=2886046 RepID=UPI00222E4F9E|nr:nitric oxide-sensing protein NosP [Marinobacter sp. AN1]UZD66453.1 FIST C-terminal domain-containing protein [Marinobacter sp. AN1]